MVGTGLGDRSWGQVRAGVFGVVQGASRKGDDDTRNGVDAEENGAGSGFL
jgi:hypothetical protein